MDSEEFIQRFLLIECDEEDRNQSLLNPLILSSDRLVGIPRVYDETRFMSFGRFRLKGRHKRQVVRFSLDLFFNSDLLFRAMHVLRRRKKFELGLYAMPNGGEVFAIREEENVVLIAPAAFEDPKDFTPFEDFVIRTNKSLFERWKTWARILHGRK